MATTAARRGRPPLAWLDPAAIGALPFGTALVVDQGNHGAHITGRFMAVYDGCLELETTTGEVRINMMKVRRARVVAALYSEGDPVLRRHVPSGEWRGGVVRVRGREVLVETLSGAWEWISEDELEPPSARDAAVPVGAR